MKSKKIIISLVVIALVLVPAVWWGISLNTRANNVAQVQSTTQISSTEISYVAKPGVTSLQQLKDAVKDVTTKASQYGEYVDAIDGHKGGDEGKYWSFYINGKMSDVGAGSYVQKGGEQIVWKFQKL